VNQDGLRKLRADLDQFWSSALAAYKVAAEHPPEQESQ
jgi:hypothetical protein